MDIVNEAERAELLALVGMTDADVERLSRADDRDVARASLAALLDDGTPGSVLALPSEGDIHLSGAGVVGHRAGLSDVTTLLECWQRLVLALGASLENFTSARGKLPDKIVAATRLALSGSFSPGSVVVPLSPEMSALEELYPKGEEPLVSSGERPLIDRAMQEAIGLLSVDPREDPEDLSNQLQAKGPRVAKALGDTMKSLVQAGFNLGVTWREVNHATTCANITTNDAARMNDLIRVKHLDVVEMTVRGILATVSMHRRWEILQGREDTISVARGDLGNEVVGRLHVGQYISLRCKMETTLGAGGEQTQRLTRLALKNWRTKGFEDEAAARRRLY